MSCPRCGKPWLEVKGNQLICACGYIETLERPTYEELLKRISTLEKQVEELTQTITRDAEKGNRT